MAEGDVIIDFAANTDAAVKEIQQLSAALGSLKEASRGGFANVSKAASGVRELAGALTSASASASTLQRLANGLVALKSAAQGNGFKTAANGASALMRALTKSSVVNTANLTKVSTALKGFAGVKISRSSISSLERLPVVVKNLGGTDVAKFSAQLSALSAALAPFSAQVRELAAAWAQLPSSLNSVARSARTVVSANKQLARANEQVSTSSSKAKGGLSSFGKALAAGGVLAALYKIRDAMAESVSAINEYVESMNLAQTVMGNAEFTKMAGTLEGIEYKSSYNIDTGEGEGFWTQAQELMGIDSAEAIKYQAVFEDIITGMGVARSSAEAMSQQLTQLGYDISSFNNISVSEAMQKIQSGVSGELEPMRRIGYDLSVARLQQDAYKMSLDQSVSSMTQAEKAQLRYYEMITQITEAHSDLARTLNSPANQMRILSAQVQILARNFGALLLPALNAIVPVLTAVIKLAQEAVASLAALFGVDLSDYFADLSTVDYSSMMGDADDADEGIEATADALDDAADAAEAATEAVEEYKNSVMGFDELNKLNDTTEKAASTPTSAAKAATATTPTVDSGKGLDLSGLGYDFFDGLALSNVEEAIEKVREALKTLIPIAAGVGAAFAAWKIGSALLSALGDTAKVSQTVGKHLAANQKAANSLSRMTFPGAQRLAGWVGNAGISMALMATKASEVVASLGKFGFAAIAVAIGMCVTHFVNLWQNSEHFRKGLEVIGDVLGSIASWAGEAFTAIGSFIGGIVDGIAQFFASLNIDIQVPQPLIDFFNAIGEFIKGLDLQWTDMGMIATGAGLILAGVLTGNPIIVAAGVVVEALEAVSIAIRAIGYAASPVHESMDALADVSEETASRFGTSLDSMEDVIREVDAIDFADAVVTQEDVDSIAGKVDDIKNTILDNLDAKRNEELANVDLLAGMITDEQVEATKAKINETYDSMAESATNGAARITEIMASASAENRTLTDEEAAEIKRIRSEMQQTLIETSGASADEMKSISDAMANNEKAAAEQAASEVIKNAIAARDEAVRTAWDTYDAKMAAADAALEAGAITREDYDRIAESARQTAQEQQDAANEAYYGADGVVARTKAGLGECSENIDYETGEQKSKIQVAFETAAQTVGSVFESMGEGIRQKLEEIKAWYEDVQEKAHEIGDRIEAFLEDPVTPIREAWQGLSQWFDENVCQPIGNFFKGMINTVIDFLNFMIGQLNSFRIDIPEPAASLVGTSYFGFDIGYIPRLAKGGVLDEGQLFVANEAGPEMVGTMDGHTAVANNTQIVEGIQQGVAQAMLSILPSLMQQQGGGDVVLVMDSKEIARAVNKANDTFARRGMVTV